jgi:putative transposase
VRFRFIDVEKANWPVRVLCRALRVSPSGYYAWKARPEPARAREDRRLGVLARAAHEQGRGTYGSPRVHAELRAQGLHVSRKRVIRLMQEQNLRGRTRRRFVRTTDSRGTHAPAPNLLARDFSAPAPYRRWVGDVKYLRTPEGFLSLAVILDLFSRFVVGWAISPLNDRRLALRALDMAVRRRSPAPGLVHHTDQGRPYASEDYQRALEGLEAAPSMSRRGNCLDNAAMESFFGTLKTELGEIFESATHAEREVFDYVEVFYNGRRRHSALGYLSPRDFEAQANA